MRAESIPNTKAQWPEDQGSGVCRSKVHHEALRSQRSVRRHSVGRGLKMKMVMS
jgi:hypothetical protein